jgi:hypothetical protein
MQDALTLDFRIRQKRTLSGAGAFALIPATLRSVRG